MLYKLPKLKNNADEEIKEGVELLFMTDRNTRKWKTIKGSITDNQNPFARTIKPLYENSQVIPVLIEHVCPIDFS